MLSNNKIKFIKSLLQKKNRFEEGCFLVEGRKNLEEVLNSNLIVKELYVTEDALKYLNSKGIATESIEVESQKNIERVSSLKSNNFGIAVVSIPDKEKLDFNNVILCLDGIGDPGNLGTIIRTADWFGIKDIVCSKECVDVFNSKVIQSSMGAFCRINVVYEDLDKIIQDAKELNVPVFGAFMNGEDSKSINGINVGVLVLGSESHGISSEIEGLVDHKVRISSFNKSSESLNVSIAASILCYELRRES